MTDYDLSRTYSCNYKTKYGYYPEFCEWMDKIELTVFEKTGCYILDFCDHPYMDYFMIGSTVDEVAKEVLTEYHEFLNIVRIPLI